MEMVRIKDMQVAMNSASQSHLAVKVLDSHSDSDFGPRWQWLLWTWSSCMDNLIGQGGLLTLTGLNGDYEA